MDINRYNKFGDNYDILMYLLVPVFKNNTVGNDTFKIFIRPRTLSPSFYYDLNFDSVGNQISGGNFEEKQKRCWGHIHNS